MPDDVKVMLAECKERWPEIGSYEYVKSDLDLEAEMEEGNQSVLDLLKDQDNEERQKSESFVNNVVANQ